MGAHVTPVFFRLQTFFTRIDGRFDEWIGAVQSCGVRTMPVRKRCRTNESGRPKPPANRIAMECWIVADYFGSSTLSITWITPLLWYTLAMVTLALLPFASVTVTLLPIALNVSGSPCTVV